MGTGIEISLLPDLSVVGVAVGNTRWNAERDLGTRAPFTPDIEPTSQLGCSLVHPLNSPVSFPMRTVRTHPRSVVADTNQQDIVFVSNLSFDFTPIGMPQGVPESLSSDPVDLILDQRGNRAPL